MRIRPNITLVGNRANIIFPTTYNACSTQFHRLEFTQSRRDDGGGRQSQKKKNLSGDGPESIKRRTTPTIQDGVDGNCVAARPNDKGGVSAKGECTGGVVKADEKECAAKFEKKVTKEKEGTGKVGLGKVEKKVGLSKYEENQGVDRYEEKGTKVELKVVSKGAIVDKEVSASNICMKITRKITMAPANERNENVGSLEKGEHNNERNIGYDIQKSLSNETVEDVNNKGKTEVEKVGVASEEFSPPIFNNDIIIGGENVIGSESKSGGLLIKL